MPDCTSYNVFTTTNLIRIVVYMLDILPTKIHLKVLTMYDFNVITNYYGIDIQ